MFFPQQFFVSSELEVKLLSIIPDVQRRELSSLLNPGKDQCNLSDLSKDFSHDECKDSFLNAENSNFSLPISNIYIVLYKN